MLKVRGVSKIYGSVEALKDVSFEADGEIVGIVGPNGAGKTTLMRILATLMAPTEGEVDYWGISSKREVRKIIGYLPEKVAFYWNKTALKNLEYYSRLYGKEIPWYFVEMLGLKDRLDVKVGEYSKGMIQKLGIIRAFIPSPQLLLLDEPTANLDYTSRMNFLDFLREYPSRATIISSHNLEELEKVCDRMVFLNRTVMGDVDLGEDLENTYRIVFEGEPDFSLEKFRLEKTGEDSYLVTINHQKNESISELIKELVENGARIVEVKREHIVQEYYRRLMDEVADSG